MSCPPADSAETPSGTSSSSDFKGWATDCIQKADAQGIYVLVGEMGAITRGIAICWRGRAGGIQYRAIELTHDKAKNSLARFYWNESSAALLAAWAIALQLAGKDPAETSLRVCAVGANDAKYEARMGAKLAELAQKKWYRQIAPEDALIANRQTKMVVVARSFALKVRFVRRNEAGFQSVDSADLGTMREHWDRRYDWAPPRRAKTEGQSELPLTRLTVAPPSDQPDQAADGPLLGLRKKALAAMVEKLSTPDLAPIRLLLQGAVGTGKTRVAYELYNAITRPGWSGRHYDAVIWLALRNFTAYPSANLRFRGMKQTERMAGITHKLLQQFDLAGIAEKLGFTFRNRNSDVEALAEILRRECPRRIFFVDNVASDLVAELPFFEGADVVLTTPYVLTPHRSRSEVMMPNLEAPNGYVPADEELQSLFDPNQTTPTAPADLEQLREFSRRVNHNPLALVEFGFRARHVAAGDLGANLARYFDDSSTVPEVGAVEGTSHDRLRETYAGRWCALLDQLQSELRASDFHQLVLFAMFCPKGVPLDQIRNVSPSFANKSFLQELYHRRIAQERFRQQRSRLAFAPFVARTIRRKVFRDQGEAALATVAQQSVRILMQPLNGRRPAENTTDPHDDSLINSHLAVLLRCFELKLESPVEDVGRLVRHCCYLLAQRTQPLHDICRSVCPDFLTDPIGAARTLLLRQATYLEHLAAMHGAVGTGRKARARQDVLAWESARNLDEQAVAAFAAAHRAATDALRTTEYRRARDFDGRAVDALGDLCRTIHRRTGKASWSCLNLRRWYALAQSAGVTDVEQLGRSREEIERIIKQRQDDLGTNRLHILVSHRFRWSGRLPGMARERSLHYLADDHLSLGIIKRQVGDATGAVDALRDAWRLAHDAEVRKVFPISHALTAGVLLLTVKGIKEDLHDRKDLMGDIELQNAARKLLLSQDDHWCFSRMQNVQEMSQELDRLGVL